MASGVRRSGFRGEEEMGSNADPYVSSGIFQAVFDLHPATCALTRGER
jgi:hypothetical protein